MKKVEKVTLCFVLAMGFLSQDVHAKRYGETLCNLPDYHCIQVQKGQTWETLWPNAEHRDLIRRLNRINTGLWAGSSIAVPHRLQTLTLFDVSPFPRKKDPLGEKIIYINQKTLAWGAYDAEGALVLWGPIAPGQDYCSDIRSRCRTPAGEFRILRKQGAGCVSSAFPRRASGRHGGAPMPYCMHFHRGYALHGSPVVPGYAASHGCVRLFIEDAKWLNQNFIDLPKAGALGTRVVIEPL